MGRDTGISWTGATWNPWRGCAKVSPGCDNCYMFRDQRRYGRDPETVVRAAPSTFGAPLQWERGLLPGATFRVFTCSWSDFFIPEADAWREEAWGIMAMTPRITYQLLTKRPGRLIAWAKGDERRGLRPHGWLPNVWAGVSVESQKYLPRVEVLSRLREISPYPAVLFASCEPLLGPLDLAGPDRTYLLGNCGAFGGDTDGRALDWVIAGGESGPNCRKMEAEWARSLRDQCAEAKVPFFFKQVGGVRASSGGDILDGRTHHEFPEEGVNA